MPSRINKNNYNKNFNFDSDSKKQSLPIDFAIALDFCSTPIIFITHEFIIRHINFKALAFFQNYLDDFKQIDPSLVCLLDYHFQYLQEIIETHQYDLTSMKLGDCISIEMPLGSLFLELRITPTFSNEYENIGFGVEIYNHSQEYQGIRQLDQAVTEARKGNFSYKIESEQFNNKMFILIFQKINELFMNLNSFFEEVALGLDHLVSGNLEYHLEEKSETNHNSLVDLTKKDLNYTINKMAEFVTNAKLFSNSMKDTINHILSISSELAMTTETEDIARNEINKKLDNFIEIMQISRTEIEQAVEIASTVRSDENHIEQVKLMFKQVSDQLRSAFDTIHFFEYILKTHLGGLREGLHEVDIGNIGKGVKIINHECEQMVSKTSQALLQVRDSMQKINRSFSFNNASVEQILDTVGDSMSKMEQMVELMSVIMDEVQKTLIRESSVFEDVKNFIQTMHSMRTTTFQSVEKTIVSVASLAYINQELEVLLNTFHSEQNISNAINENRQKIDELKEIEKQTTAPSDSIIHLWGE